MNGFRNIDGLYIISYLIHKSDGSNIVGYADLAARIQYIIDSVKDDEKIANAFAERLAELVEITDDNQLKWANLRDYVESASSDETGSMFLTIKSEEQGPNKWGYKFESSAPEAILEDKMENLSEHDEALKQKVINAANIDEEQLYEEVYS